MIIFAACDQGYYDSYAGAFERSAQMHGHEVLVHNTGELAQPGFSKAYHSTLRFLMLPELVLKHKQVLVLDVDSIINAPLVMGDYDLGLFLRPGSRDSYMMTLAGVVYVTEHAIEFVDRLRDELQRTIDARTIRWGEEQRVLWELYNEMRDRYRIRHFDKTFLSWDDVGANVWSPKGPRKKHFQARVEALWAAH